MKIIILGAGQVGSTLAENLASEQNDITVVDQRGDRLRALQDRLDIGTVRGHAAYPSVLRRAGADDADLLVAVTNSDEINMIACQVAHSLFRTPTKISRIRAKAYVNRPELFAPDSIPIDVIISPEQLVTNAIVRLLQYPGALQVLDFAGGRLQLAAIKAYYGGPMVGNRLRDLRAHLPEVNTRVAAIFRRNQSVAPRGDTIIEAEDEIFFIAPRHDILEVMAALRRLDTRYQRVMIAGGGDIGERLAETIEERYQVKLIEQSHERCLHLAEKLDRTIVLHGNASDRDLLITENIDDVDVFCALTNDDEANIMASLLAKRLGARKVLTLITNPAYVDLVQGGEIDIALSPQQITIGSLLTHVRRGDIVSVHALRRGAAEAIEIIAHGDSRTSRVVGRAMDELSLPPGVTIGAVVRGEQVLMAHGALQIATNDHVILFLSDKSRIKQVEQLFQVGIHFF